ncbi:MAG: hypothetical protein ONA90_10970 [candidate division KSB1 bacterium]|nr:hypothetical protein [candidate division KSB1 bacterium]
MNIGATYLGQGSCEFIVWAPFKNQVELKIVLPEEKLVPMQKSRDGYRRATVEGFSSGFL